jgi:hypothetical protein
MIQFIQHMELHPLSCTVCIYSWSTVFRCVSIHIIFLFSLTGVSPTKWMESLNLSFDTFFFFRLFSNVIEWSSECTLVSMAGCQGSWYLTIHSSTHPVPPALPIITGKAPFFSMADQPIVHCVKVTWLVGTPAAQAAYQLRLHLLL